MTDALNLLKTRRSVPHTFLVEPGPDEDQLRDILTIGARVPDHGKLAPWRFIVVAGEERSAAGKAVADLYARNNAGEAAAAKAVELGERFSATPVTILVVSRTAPHPKIPEWEQFISAGSVAMNLIHAAHAMGFAAHWVSGFVASDPDVSALFGVAEDEKTVAVVHIGTPSVPASERSRPDIDDKTTFWHG